MGGLSPPEKTAQAAAIQAVFSFWRVVVVLFQGSRGGAASKPGRTAQAPRLNRRKRHAKGIYAFSFFKPRNAKTADQRGLHHPNHGNRRSTFCRRLAWP